MRVFADPVSISTAVHKGYGRMVFNWPKPVPYSAGLTDRKLVIEFGRPIETSYAGVTRRLSKYIGAAKPSGDGRSVTFSLKDDFVLRSFDLGKTVVVDIFDMTAEQETAVKTDKTPAQGQSAKGAPKVRVRTGEHEKYSRIVFDWSAKPPYTVQRSGDEAVLSFARPARIDVRRLNSRPPKYVLGAKSKLKADGVTVTLHIPATFKLRHFLFGPKVVVDIMPPGSGKAVHMAKAPGGKPAAEKEPPATPAKEAAGAPKRLSPGEPQKQPPQKQTPQKQTTEAEKPQKIGKPQDLTPQAKTKKKAKAILAAAGAVSMRFDWDEPVAAAVFRRAGNLWVVFDKPVKMDTEKLRASGGNIFHGIEQMPSDRATVLRMNTVAGVNPEIKRDGLAWILNFRKRPLKALTAIEVKAQPNSPVGARLFIPVADPGAAIIVKDPEVGDSIVAVPVITLGRGIAQTYEYPQVRILKSAQGVVIAPKSDAIKVRTLRQGISVSSLDGLQVSPVTALLAANASLGSVRPLTRAFDLKGWGNVNVKIFGAKRREFEKRAAMAKGLERKKARFELVKLLLSNGFAAEALGVMRVMAEETPELLNNPEFRAFRGASNFLMGRYKDARKDLRDASLKGNDEGAFWLAAVQAAEGDRVGAARELRRTGAVIQPYPKALKTPLSMLIAETALDVEDAMQAERFIKAIKVNEPSPARKGQLNYLEGRLMELKGDFDGAVGRWEMAQEGSHPQSRAKAAASRVQRLLKLKEITRAEAIEELEKLRFAWRGDNFEFNLLRRLGRLYMDEGDFRNGLRTLKQAVTYFRKHKKTPEMTQEMQDAFSRLYIDDEADQMAPITAIALYDEFKELSPVGAKGDEMVQKLAERLIKVDLLDRGAALLEGQLKYRLKGKDKARVGAKLALVHILERKYEEAARALEDTAMSGLAPELVDRRRRLRARALIGLKRGGEALALLNEDKSIDADLLRSDVFWNNKKWPKAAQSLRRLVRAFGAKPNKPLDAKQSNYVLNLAVALALSGNERGLGRVRAGYGAAMNKSPLKDAFRLITSPESLGLIDYRTIASKVGVAESFQSFMANYHERMKNKSLDGG